MCARGGSRDPLEFSDIALGMEDQAADLAKCLFVTSKVKQVYTCASGVTTFKSLQKKIPEINNLSPNMVVVHCLSNDLARVPSGATPDVIRHVVSKTVEFCKHFDLGVSVVFLAVVPRYKKISSQPWEFKEYARIANGMLWNYAQRAKHGSVSIPPNFHFAKMQGWWPTTEHNSIPDFYHKDGIHPREPHLKHSKAVRKAVLNYGNTPDGV